MIDPPCHHCNAACCKSEFGEYAVWLDEDEHFAEAVDFEEMPSHTIKVIPYEDGRCIFLGDDDQCTIYDRRPNRCRSFNCLELHGQQCFFLDDRPEVVQLIELTLTPPCVDN